jgi:hypothetical protein
LIPSTILESVTTREEFSIDGDETDQRRQGEDEEMQDAISQVGISSITNADSRQRTGISNTSPRLPGALQDEEMPDVNRHRSATAISVENRPETFIPILHQPGTSMLVQNPPDTSISQNQSEIQTTKLPGALEDEEASVSAQGTFRQWLFLQKVTCY